MFCFYFSAVSRVAAFLSCFIVCLCVVGFAVPAEANMVKRLTIQGTQLFDERGQPIRLRGANLEGVSAGEAQDIAQNIGFNFVRLRISYEDENLNDRGDDFSESYKNSIHSWVRVLKQNGIWIDLEMRANDKYTNDAAFYDISSPLFKKYLNCWLGLVREYKDTDYIAAYGLLAEPSPNHTKVDDPVGTLVSFQKKLMDEISVIDPVTPFIIGPDWNYDTMGYRHDDYYTRFLSYRGRIIYAVNFLSPKEWIKDGNWTVDHTKPTYPYSQANVTQAGFAALIAPLSGGATASAGGSKKNRSNQHSKNKTQQIPVDGGVYDNDMPIEKLFNEQRVLPENYPRTLTPYFIKWYLQWPVAFKERYQVPLLVDQFGASTHSSGQLAYERDLIKYFEFQGFNWSRWSYNAGSKPRLIEGNPEVIAFYKMVMERIKSQPLQ
ncbi:MAG: cellulase family glycosylhydrolase [Pseudobdellovibrionaceae bacterium]